LGVSSRLPKDAWLDSLWEHWRSLFHELGVDDSDEFDVEEIVGPAFEKQTGLTMIGAGTTRAVFDVGDNMVLKLPTADGYVANKIECARWLAFANVPEGKWLAPVLACDANGRWLVQHKAKTMPRSDLETLLTTTAMPHELAKLGIEDFRTTMQWGKIAGHPVLLDYGTWHHEDDKDVQALKQRLLALA
jgi:hypothetical protein